MKPILPEVKDCPVSAAVPAPVPAGDPASPALDEVGPGRYFDQAVFDLHFLLLSAHARRMAADTDLPFAVDRDGRVTLKPAALPATADESQAG